VKQEVANLPSPPAGRDGKTLKPRSEKPDSVWKRTVSKRLDKVPERVQRKRPGCNANEHPATAG